ncbi:MAG: UrcA family protein [Pseudomonadota bacterium]
MLRHFLATRASVFFIGGVLTALAGGLAVSAPAHAAEPRPRTERVSYADLDLRTSAGRDALESRIGRATRRVCRIDSSVVPLARQRERRCEAASLEDALRQMRRAVQYALADNR